MARWRASGVTWCAVWLLAAAGGLAADEARATCPEALAQALRLVVVTTASMDDKTASITVYGRSSLNALWRQSGRPMVAVVGARGLGWGWDQTRHGTPGEPVKREGDKRTPAGFYAMGRPFGSRNPGVPGYLPLRKGQTFCVDDARSPHYGRIVPRRLAGRGISGEEMATIGLYRQGIAVEYPANASVRGGSCIFIHVWRGPTSGTAGCIATDEADVVMLQKFVAGKPAAIAVLPDRALEAFAKCLP